MRSVEFGMRNAHPNLKRQGADNQPRGAAGFHSGLSLRVEDSPRGYSVSQVLP